MPLSSVPTGRALPSTVADLAACGNSNRMAVRSCSSRASMLVTEKLSEFGVACSSNTFALAARTRAASRGKKRGVEEEAALFLRNFRISNDAQVRIE